MDAASKYANLPGIAFDQPDCYETSDLPESDQQRSRVKTEDVSANVEILSVDPGDAFKRFEGKSLTVSGADFSGIPTAGRGYQSWGQWELLGQHPLEEETPLQKYRRLQIEVQELQQTFAGMNIPADAASGRDFAGDIQLKDICADLKSLDTDLKKLDCDSCVDSLIASTTSAKTLTQLEQSLRTAVAPKQTSASGSVKDVTAAGSNAVTYELSCSVDASQSLSLHHVEERVRALEQLVGSGDKVSPLSGVTGARSICDAVRLLSHKVLLMDPSQLDHLDSRLSSILEKLSSISERKSAVEDVEREVRVNGTDSTAARDRGTKERIAGDCCPTQEPVRSGGAGDSIFRCDFIHRLAAESDHAGLDEQSGGFEESERKSQPKLIIVQECSGCI